jgi:uncharacterized HAD superfamily protein
MSKEIEDYNSEELIKDAIKRLNDELRLKGVGFDIDGVEVDSATKAIERFNEFHGTSYCKDDLTSVWEMANWASRIPGIRDPKQYATKLWNSDEVFANANHEYGALILTRFLHQEVVFPQRYTARPSYTEKVTRRWFLTNKPWVEQDLIHIQREGNGVNHSFKVDGINEQGIGYFFEDDTTTAELIEQNTRALVILVPQPWNKFYESSSDRIIVPKDYGGLPSLIRSYLTLATTFMQ